MCFTSITVRVRVSGLTVMRGINSSALVSAFFSFNNSTQLDILLLQKLVFTLPQLNVESLIPAEQRLYNRP